MAVNKFGFPLSSCYRCGGSGYYGPVQVQAGKCFACGGSGFVVRAGKARKAWVAFVAAWRKSSTILAGQVQGPMVLWSGEGRGKGQRYEVVGPVVVSDQCCGWSGSGEAKKETAWWCELPLADGSVKRFSTMNILTVDKPVRPVAAEFLVGIKV